LKAGEEISSRWMNIIQDEWKKVVFHPDCYQVRGKGCSQNAENLQWPSWTVGAFKEDCILKTVGGISSKIWTSL
jgi:hypothetical protein